MTASVVIAQRWAALRDRPQFDVNFFIESVFPEYLPTGRVNCLLVNPEWFRDGNLAHLPRLDFVLCKTPSSVEAFRGLPVICRDLAFTSPDKSIRGFVRRGAARCLHLSGQSAVKGTEAVVEAWSRHPEWPELTVVRRARRYGGEERRRYRGRPTCATRRVRSRRAAATAAERLRDPRHPVAGGGLRTRDRRGHELWCGRRHDRCAADE
jgi:hypothetical protein